MVFEQRFVPYFVHNTQMYDSVARRYRFLGCISPKVAVTTAMVLSLLITVICAIMLSVLVWFVFIVSAVLLFVSIVAVIVVSIGIRRYNESAVRQYCVVMLFSLIVNAADIAMFIYSIANPRNAFLFAEDCFFGCHEALCRYDNDNYYKCEVNVDHTREMDSILAGIFVVMFVLSLMCIHVFRRYARFLSDLRTSGALQEPFCAYVTSVSQGQQQPTGPPPYPAATCPVAQPYPTGQSPFPMGQPMTLNIVVNAPDGQGSPVFYPVIAYPSTSAPPVAPAGVPQSQPAEFAPPPYPTKPTS